MATPKMKIELRDKERIDLLTTEEKGILLDAALKYHTGEEIPQMPPAVGIVFSYMVPKFEHEKEISEIRKIAVAKHRRRKKEMAQ